MSSFKELYQSDMARYGGKPDFWNRQFHYYYRKLTTCKNKALVTYYRLMFRRVCQKHGIEIPRVVTIGKGFYLGHTYNITINKNAVIGNNVNLHKGVTIGQENRGKRKGCPTIGNKVWIGINATVVGNVTIGDDVLIAPNSFVNCDVPPHSVVLGNPCSIIPKENATEGYINHTV